MVNPSSADNGFKDYEGSQTLQKTGKQEVQQMVPKTTEQSQDLNNYPSGLQKYFFNHVRTITSAPSCSAAREKPAEETQLENNANSRTENKRVDALKK